MARNYLILKYCMMAIYKGVNYSDDPATVKVVGYFYVCIKSGKEVTPRFAELKLLKEYLKK